MHNANIAVLEADLKKKQAAALALFESNAKTAHEENRETTDEERAAVQALVTEAETIKGKIARAKGDDDQRAAIERLSQGIGLVPHTGPAAGNPAARLSLGQQFVRSPEYEFFRKGGHRAQSAWRSPSVELHGHPLYDQRAATITSDPASGGALLIPQYLPGILPLPTRPLVVADLFAPGTATSNAITFMREKTFTNAAAAVAEGAAKPESAITFEAVTDPVRKLAHWLPVTEEMLEDEAQIASYIDARLRIGVQLTEDDQLLNGSGVAPNLLGVLATPGLGAAVPVGVAPATAADAIFQQMMALAWSSFLMPDGIVMNPADWGQIALTKTSTGEYLGGGPFVATPTPTLWGLPVAVTPAMVANTVLVGAFKTGAQIFRRGGIRVEASNSHQDFFIKNLVAIRAEERLALAIYRPSAFGTVTGA
jgi:HK97 family phage major capsid protein